MQANHDFLSPMHQSMVHVEIVLISKHQSYSFLMVVLGRGVKKEGEGNYSAGRKGILKQRRNKKATAKSTVLGNCLCLCSFLKLQQQEFVIKFVPFLSDIG